MVQNLHDGVHRAVIFRCYEDVGNMILAGVRVLASCRRCNHEWDVDLARIRDLRGGYYSLCNRVARCPKCRSEAGMWALGGQVPHFPLTCADPTWGVEHRERCGWCGSAGGLKPRDWR